MKNKLSRRDFLINTGTAALFAGAAATTRASENTPQDTKKLGWAIVGLGGYAQYAMERFAPCRKSAIAALVSSEREKAKKFALRYGINESNLYNYDNFDEIVNNPGIDVVYIITPNGLHADFAVRALKAGKHVITEKTMAANSADALKMIATAKEMNKKLMVAYRARFDVFNQNAIRMAREEEFGKITTIMAHKGFSIGDNLGKNRWRINRKLSGGGSLVDIGVYSIQACRYIAGKNPSEVNAIVHNSPNDGRFKEVEETITFSMKFPNGTLANGTASWNYSNQNYFRAVGTRGWFELDPATSNGNLRMFASKDIVRDNRPQPSRVVEERFYQNVDQLPVMFDHFSDCILNNTEPLLNMEEGLRDVEVMEAIYKSAETGKTVNVNYRKV